MQSFTVILSALFAIQTAQALPTPQDAPRAVEHIAPKDAAPTVCTITGDGVRYRTCPSIDNNECPAIGQYPIDTQVSLSCYTSDLNNTAIYWDRTADGQYVYEQYVDRGCVASLPPC